VHKPAHQWTGRPGMTDPKARLADMDLEGIDVAVLFGGALSSAAIGLVENPALALATCHAYNDWLAEYCGAAPDRLKGVAAVPFQDPEAGARELQRAVREQGLVAVRVPTWPDGRDPGARRFDPIYAAAEELGVPACLHLLSARTVGADRFDNFFLKHVFYGADVFMAFAGMLAGGVLERFPGLRIGVFEAGCGWIPYLMERVHEHWELFSDQLPPSRATRPSRWPRTAASTRSSPRRRRCHSSRRGSGTAGSCTPRTTPTSTACAPTRSRRWQAGRTSGQT